MRTLKLIGIMASCIAVAVPGGACARANDVQRLSLPAQPLRSALQGLARLYQVELLFSNESIGPTVTHAVSGTYRIEEALAAVLDGTGFVVRRSSTGGYIVVKQDHGADGGTPPVPEIVVIGRRTQNADIQRFTNDVQPYQVITRADVRYAHAATVEELIGKRMSADARGLSLSQMPVLGQASPQSMVDLRGLGADETLVLVDGRRMPRLPGLGLEFVQPDVNALSPESIERAEVATSTAGGIYGPGAIAGVVNLVLRRDYRGAEFAVTGGVTQRGDAPQGRIDARLGFSPDHGATDVMVSYSRSSGAGLRVRDRDFAENAAIRAFSNNAALYQYGDLPASSSLNVASSARTPLTLKPGYGGGVLGGFVTTLPVGDARSAAQTGALLIANAGRVDTVPSNSADGGLQSLTIAHDTSSTIANVRHRFGGLELYGDLIRLIDRGAVVTTSTNGILEMKAEDSRNPFQQDIDLSFPTPAFATLLRQRIVTLRGSLGAVMGLSAGWKGNLDLSLGSARQEVSSQGETLGLTGYTLLSGLTSPGASGINPFAGSTVFQAALAQYAVPYQTSSIQTNHMSDVSLRIAGPIATVPGGVLFATLLAEQRHEHVSPTTAQHQVFDIPSSQALRGYAERVRSAYVELRAPLLSDQARFAPLRGLEVQIAARVDATRVDASPDPNDDPSIVYDRYRSADRAAFVFTAGLKVKPLPGLLVRTSFATGEMAPPLRQLAGSFVVGKYLDPKRNNAFIVPGTSYKLIVFKDPLVPERAQTLSAGFVATPFRTTGAKLSLDYSRIRRSHEAGGSSGFVLQYLLYENLYPGRVTRLPLTPEDAAKGYTGGVITQIDASYTTIGWTKIDAVDARIDVPFRTARHGEIVIYAAGTWQPFFRRYIAPQYPVQDYTNRIDGALALRGNAGVDWTKGRLGLSLATQFYGGYSVTTGSTLVSSLNSQYVALQGASRISASLTVDLAATYRVPLAQGGTRARALDVRFGIQDLFDRRPATVLNAAGGYSVYADPRLRRVELTLAIGL